MPKLDIDRRDFFRLEDQIHLIKQPIERHMITDDPYSAAFRIPKQALLISQLRTIEGETQSFISQINETNRALGTYLTALDQKLECLARYIISDTKGDDLMQKESVNLSEGGVSFYSDHPYPEESFLHLTMVLFPSYASLAAISQVKTVQLLDQQPTLYRIGSEFVSLLEADRKQLSRHIRRKQSMELRERNQKNEQNE